MYMIFFNVPESHLYIVKNAIFNAGAGRVGNYSHGAWQILGEGQFMPLAGSNPFIGAVGKLETVAEYHVQTICDSNKSDDVISALKSAHPYEVPSYQVFKLEDK